MDADTKRDLELFRRMGNKKLRFGGDFGNNRRAQVNVKDDGMDLVRKTVTISLGLKGFSINTFKRQIQDITRKLFLHVTRRASVDNTGGGNHESSGQFPPDQIDMFDIRVGAGDSDYNPTVDFRIRVSTVKVGFEKHLYKRFKKIQDNPSELTQELVTELKILMTKHHWSMKQLGCDLTPEAETPMRLIVRGITLVDHTVSEDRKHHVKVHRTKHFPTDSLDYFVANERWRKHVDDKQQSVLTKQAHKLQSKIDLHHRWKCGFCGQTNRVGTQTCDACKRGGDYYPRGLVAADQVMPLPFHGDNIKKLKVEMVFSMHRDGVQMDSRDKMGFSGLHCACKLGNLPIADALLQCGADVNALSQDDYLPLHFAALAGEAFLVARILRHNAGHRRTHKTNPEYWGEAEDKEEAYEDGEMAAQIDPKSKEGRLASLLALHGGGDSKDESDSNSTGKVDEEEIRKGNEGSQYERKETTEELIQDIVGLPVVGADVDSLQLSRRLSVMNVCEVGPLGASSSAPVLPPEVAVKQAASTLWGKLREAKRNVSHMTEGRSAGGPLHPTRVDYKTKSDGFTALHLAAQGNHAKCAQLLLDAGADVESITRRMRRTALHFTAYEGHASTLKVLLHYGADPSVRDGEGWRPLQLAQFRHNSEVAMILGDQGVEHGEWKDGTFLLVSKTAGWDARTDDQYVIKTGQEGPYGIREPAPLIL